MPAAALPRRAAIGARGSLCLALAGLSFAAAAATPAYVRVPGGMLVSVLSGGASPNAPQTGPQNPPAAVTEFMMRATPVTAGEFFAFIKTNPEWQRDKVPQIFADGSYLSAYKKQPLDAAAAARPVTNVSWYAAQAYCEAEGARLPTWYEWEYVAAANETRADARSDPAWRAKILSWYAQSTSMALPQVGGAPNFYGVRDMHGVIWEWVDDFGAFLISADSRTQGDPQKLQYCGAGAISLQDRDNYAILMRIALLSAIGASNTTGSLGFRCAKPMPKP